MAIISSLSIPVSIDLDEIVADYCMHNVWIRKHNESQVHDDDEFEIDFDPPHASDM